MEEIVIKEGILFRKLMSNQKLCKTWIFNYRGEIVRGVNINGIKIWFPKELRTMKSDLNHKLLKEMRLKSMDDEELQFFLIPYQSPGKEFNSNFLSTSNLLKLHEAIAVVLINKNDRTASLQDITQEIADRNLYRQQNGVGPFPPKGQIRLRTHPNTKGGKTYAHLFEFIEPDRVKLKNI